MDEPELVWYLLTGCVLVIECSLFLTCTSSSWLITQGRFCIVSTKDFSSARVILRSLKHSSVCVSVSV